VDDVIFEGTYEYVVGTYMMFKPGKQLLSTQTHNIHPQLPGEEGEEGGLRHLCNTTKKLRFKKVDVKPINEKDSGDEDLEGSEDETMMYTGKGKGEEKSD